MVARLFNLLFGCWHKNYSFPRSIPRGHRRAGAASLTGTYVVCLDCGKEFPYDWHEMRVISRPERRPEAVSEPAQSYAGK